MASDSTILFWFDIVRNFALVVILLVWVASVAWVVRDARDRGVNPFAAFLLAAVFPFAGAFVYALIRPARRVAEVREHELWLRLAEQGSRVDRCLVCGTPSDRDFVVCPGCGVTLRQRCNGCGSSLELSWAICPYCGTREDEEVWTEQEPARAAAAADVTPLEPAKRARTRKRTTTKSG